MAYVIGLTGGIGSGKTVISDHFATLGVPIIDTDVIARQVVEPGQETLDQLINAFGKHILTPSGELDRNALRQLAFSSPQNKVTLDNITHPAIRDRAWHEIQHAAYPYCVVVVPLLDSSSAFTKVMDRILVVTAERQIKIDRVKVRSNLSQQEVEQIMATQLDDSDRLAFANDIIANNGSLESVYQQVESLHQHYLKLSTKQHH